MILGRDYMAFYKLDAMDLFMREYVQLAEFLDKNVVIHDQFLSKLSVHPPRVEEIDGHPDLSLIHI